jgi:hypothetical protein
MILDDFLDAIEFPARESTAALEAYRVERELGLRVISFDVDVRRFVPVARVEEKR